MNKSNAKVPVLAYVPSEFKDSPMGRKICREIILEVSRNRRSEASETMSDVR